LSFNHEYKNSPSVLSTRLSWKEDVKHPLNPNGQWGTVLFTPRQNNLTLQQNDVSAKIIHAPLYLNV
jgi:hypothetical protein